eukprot:CAMPEP_0197640382 /NCGR_PEP_ID=MMETSP1338-20131121/14693_1 /TAXON_ID=43686 ORGANISM="Pelagodinium beii, Strain RCC1491" /NCGR_SAMPLE_ID=MMETSP1338 /ASSEMBLY_ACC=CAM_ASM_000754 /LENGTH=140 /DNA_ID=CAMNT_0043213227 /DNA_START=68 /DNA_END=486 /DNA_ORIENTATION=+
MTKGDIEKGTKAFVVGMPVESNLKALPAFPGIVIESPPRPKWCCKLTMTILAGVVLLMAGIIVGVLVIGNENAGNGEGEGTQRLDGRDNSAGQPPDASGRFSQSQPPPQARDDKEDEKEDGQGPGASGRSSPCEDMSRPT